MVDSLFPELPLSKAPPKATGNLWRPSIANPTTVPVPLPVVVVRVEGPFTALDRKLWLALVRHAWDNLDKPGHIHQLPIADLVSLFRRVSGRRDLGDKGVIAGSRAGEESDAARLWQSIRRLVKTTIEWEDDSYQGINSLLGARMDKEVRKSGKLYYTFDPLLVQHVLAPRVWARLNVHVVMKLRSKYAVTLYEILEAYANRENTYCIASLDEVRNWLKVPAASSYGGWKDFKRRVIEPAVLEINKHADEAGFLVEYKPIRQGKAFSKIEFKVTKTDGRQQRDTLFSSKANMQMRRSRAADGIPDPDSPPMPSGEALESFREKWPGKDPYEVVDRFQDKWRAEGCAVIRKPDAAFLKFAEGMFASRVRRGRAAA
ncbi:replication initiation protein [Methylobacterium sp. WSM2598]|uniref:replication initiation protein n=1 Tax=Methylobacterium sp. WSM2598 TaxID=398261 RepID=UPI0003641056|nr:replication initiation protein [Methylobacterium sp. WSM2598]